MRKKTISTFLIVFFGIIGLSLIGCSNKIRSSSGSNVDFMVDDRTMYFQVQAFVFPNPNLDTQNIYIPIAIWLETKDNYEKWPREFMVERVRISSAAKKFYIDKSILDEPWIRDNKVNSYIDVSIPMIGNPQSLDIKIWLQDTKGEKYRRKIYCKL